MANRFVRADLHGTCQGQEIQHTLWYFGDTSSGAAAAAADALHTKLMLDVYPDFCSGLVTLYVLNTVDYQVYTSGWAPELIIPQTSEVDITGSQGQDLMGPAPCAILKFLLDNTFGDTGAGRPVLKRSYIAYGPIGEPCVDDAGDLDFAGFGGSALADLKVALNTTWSSVAGLGDVRGIRVGSPDGLGVRSYAGYTDTAFRTHASFRRSRNK